MYFTKKDHSSFKLEGSCNPFTPFCEYFFCQKEMKLCGVTGYLCNLMQWKPLRLPS